LLCEGEVELNPVINPFHFFEVERGQLIEISCTIAARLFYARMCPLGGAW
jgi:hypothetical protein